MLSIILATLSTPSYFIREDLGRRIFYDRVVLHLIYLRNSTQNPEIFRLGIKRATKAIKNAIGPKVLDYFNTMSEVVSIIPQEVLALPPHMIRKVLEITL